MSTESYLEEMGKIQKSILDLLEDETIIDGKFQSPTIIFDDLKIYDNKYKLMSLLHLLLKISNHHHRNLNFINKIEKILLDFKDSIKKYFSNIEIFNIFKGNKRIILFLIEEKILIIDENIIKRITSQKYEKKKYLQYFSPEIKPFIGAEWFPKQLRKIIFDELPEDFYENRKIGENETYICTLIRLDSVKEFIIYINQNAISLNSNIEPSIYETNSFLVKKQQSNISFIEYAAFFGAIEIFQYLKMNEATFPPQLFLYAIHSNNAEMIHLLEENDDNRNDKSYQMCLLESIKCHHNDISNYFQNNYFKSDIENSMDVFKQNLKYYNFAFIENKNFDKPYYFVKYDYYILLDSFFKANKDNQNIQIIYEVNIFNEISYKKNI